MPKLKLIYAPFADLDKEQDQAIQKALKLSLIKFICWWRVGLGKTRIALALYTLLFQRQPRLPSICIFVARPSFLFDLKEEVVKIGLDAQISTKDNRWFLSATKPTILFVSFANLQPLIEELHWIKRYLKLVIVDELYLYSNPKTRRSEELRELCKCSNALGLAGTILPARDNFAVWGQLRAISLESKVARNATNFRSLYQTSYKADFGSGSCRLFSPAPNWKSKIISRIEEHVHIRMPDKINEVKETITYVPLTKLQESLIRSVLEDFYLECRGIEQDYKYTFQTISKVRGIINGWLTAKGGRIEYFASQKIYTLFDQLAEISECGEQCIVWCAYRNDVEMLSRLCKIANLQMVGGRLFDVECFRRGNHPIIFSTLGSGSSVNHFKKVSYAKFFSLGYKKLDYEQAKGRNDRRSSDGQFISHYGHIQARHSMDEVLFKHVQKTRETEKDFINEFLQWSQRSTSNVL